MKKSTLPSNIVVSLLILITSLICSTSVYAAKLYKWVDKNGNISYQDQPPPESAKILKEDTLKAAAKTTSAEDGNTAPVVVYVGEDCPPCDRLITRLTELGLSTEQRALSEDRGTQRELLDQLGEVSIPTMVLNGKYINDADADSLPKYLQEAGYILNEKTATTEDASAAEDNETQ